MLNAELYKRLEHAFKEYRINEEVEDVLLELAESMADTGIVGREVLVREQAGHGEIAARGICEKGEDGGEPEVFIKTLAINGTEFEIEDYLL